MNLRSPPPTAARIGALTLCLAVASAVAQTPDPAASHAAHAAAAQQQQELAGLREQARLLEQSMQLTAADKARGSWKHGRDATSADGCDAAVLELRDEDGRDGTDG